MTRQFDIDSKVHEWYSEAYPRDVLRKAIDKDVTFRDIVESLNRNENPIFLIGFHDPFVRDRIFGKVAVLSDVSFDVVNNKWRLGNEAPDVPLKDEQSFDLGGVEGRKLMENGQWTVNNEGIGEFANSPMLKNAAPQGHFRASLGRELQNERKVDEGNIVGGNDMDIEILSFEECDDKDYGETVVQFRDGDVISFCFTDLTVQNILANPNRMLMEIQESKEQARDRERPLWSDLSNGLLEAVLYNPFDMHFVEYENFDDDVDTSKLEEKFFDEVNALALWGVVTCGEDGALMTVYAGAMGSINWKEHPTYGEPCFEQVMEKEAEKQPYRVLITETYTREVVVYAEDALDAEQKVENLCNDSVIDLDYEDFHERSTECRGVARESDLKIHEVYGESGRILPDGVKLLDDQIAEAMSQVDNNRTGGEPERGPEL